MTTPTSFPITDYEATLLLIKELLLYIHSRFNTWEFRNRPMKRLSETESAWGCPLHACFFHRALNHTTDQVFYNHLVDIIYKDKM